MQKQFSRSEKAFDGSTSSNAATYQIGVEFRTPNSVKVFLINKESVYRIEAKF